MPPSPSARLLHDWLNTRLGDVSTLRSGPPEVNRLALALDPADLPPTLDADAVFLHRSHRLGDLVPHLSVLTSHDGFDAALTTGENWALARTLGWHDVTPLTSQSASGLLATAPQHDWPGLLAALEARLGGLDEVVAPAAFQPRLALVNAMRPELLDELAAKGAGVLVTGQLRRSALPRARELGLGVVALGHRRSELWGLRQLAGELQEAFPELACTVYGEA
ncbi:Nif3-like dinuclear metal center hexameric protein [Deinococcus altitudinis]|uniref:Nif3-like dinuclear metal center hexameric protein n=1 Tax=Deinococcus altitudinis TaxID=468914 RepID=UPI0038921D1E